MAHGLFWKVPLKHPLKRSRSFSLVRASLSLSVMTKLLSLAWVSENIGCLQMRWNLRRRFRPDLVVSNHLSKSASFIQLKLLTWR